MPHIKIAEIDVEIVRKDIKNIHFGVYPPSGRVRVAVPINVDDEAVRIAVISKLPWIRKQIQSFQNQERQSRREYVSRESHYYLGKRYLLSIEEGKGRQGVTIHKSKGMILSVHPDSTVEKEKRSSPNGTERTEKDSQVSIENGKRPLVTVTAWGIRKMKTRWGVVTRRPEEY